MSRPFYQTTKVVKVVEKDKVVVKVPDTKTVRVVDSNNKVIVRSPGLTGQKGDPGTSTLTGPGLPSSLIGKVGDFYVDTNTSIMYGPKTSSGWDTSNPVFEGFNRDLLGKVFNVSDSQTVADYMVDGTPCWKWTIEHNFGYNPNATITDSVDSVIEGDISYPNENTIVLRFIGANSGKVYLS